VKLNRYLLLLLAQILTLGCLSFETLADYKLASAYYSQGKYQKAIDEIKADLDANPDYEFGHRLVGLCHLALKNHSLAVTSLTRAVQLKSTTFSTYLGLGQAYFSLERFDKCIEALNQGDQYAKDMDRYRLLRLRGSAYYRMQKFPEAVNDIKAGFQFSVGEWSDYSTLGISYFRMDRLDDSIQALTKALAMKPDHGPSAEFLAKIYFKQGVAALSAKQYENALGLFRKALERNAKDSYIYYNMAEAMLFLKKYAEAEKALDQAIALNPQSSEAHQRLGLVYEKQKKWDLALASYQKAAAIKTTPAITEAINRLKAAKNPK
jgi:tetratricopeptide (TPR) repeat protein